MKKMIMFVLALLPLMGLGAASDGSIVGYPTVEPWLGDSHYEEYPKFWYSHIEMRDGKEAINLNYKIVGDSTVSGKIYAKVAFGYETAEDLLKNRPLEVLDIYPKDKASYADTLLFRQEGDRVFCLSDEDRKEKLVLDYGLREGDIFTDAIGGKFKIKKVEYIEKDTCGIRCWDKSRPKKVILTSEDGNTEDIWVEGIGSLNWGIVPPFLLNSINPLKEAGAVAQNAKTAMSWGINLLGTFQVNLPGYKFTPFELDNYEGTEELSSEDGGSGQMEYKFMGDTLCVTGFYELSCYITYAECVIKGNRIDFMVKDAYTQDVFDCKHEAFVNVRIPGFEAGIYEIGFPNEEHITVECKGTDGMEAIHDSTIHNDATAYDLSGRKVVNPKRGLYIQGGRKVVRP